MSHFQRIGLLGSLDVPEVVESLHKLEAFLRAQGREVVYEEQAASLVNWQLDKGLQGAHLDQIRVRGGYSCLCSPPYHVPAAASVAAT